MGLVRKKVGDFLALYQKMEFIHHFKRLPPEISIFILEFLPISDLISASSVSRTFFQFAGKPMYDYCKVRLIDGLETAEKGISIFYKYFFHMLTFQQIDLKEGNCLLAKSSSTYIYSFSLTLHQIITLYLG